MTIEIVDLDIQQCEFEILFVCLPKYQRIHYHKSAINPIETPFLLVKSPFSYGFPMVFLWVSCGFPMDSHGTKQRIHATAPSPWVSKLIQQGLARAVDGP